MKTPQTYKDYFGGKVSNALEAMVTGLRMTEKERGFEINMGSFGTVTESGVCYGCAATAAVRACLKHPIPSDYLGGQSTRAFAAEADVRDEYQFESSIDRARTGDLNCLIDYMGAREAFKQHRRLRRINTRLVSNNYLMQLPTFERRIALLRKHDL